PLRKDIRIIESHAGDGGRLQPNIMRADSTVHLRPLRFRNRQARIITPMCGEWPTVIFPGLGDIDLIATTRPMLMRPYLPRPRVKRRTLLITMTVAPDFRPGLWMVDERVVFRDLTFSCQPHQFALMFI